MRSASCSALALLAFTGCLFPSVDDLSSGGDASPDAPQSSIAFVQVTSTDFGASPSGTLSFDDAVGAHDTIIAAVSFDNPSATLTASDSLGSVFTTVVGPIDSPAPVHRSYLVAAVDVAGGDDAVTLTLSDSASAEFDVYLHEYAGIVSLDASAGQAGTSTTMTSGPIAVASAGELVFGFAWTNDQATAGGGFTTRSTFKDNVTEDRVTDAPGAYAATASQQGSRWTMLGGAFKGL